MPKTITIFGPDLRRFTLTMRDDQAGQNGPNLVTIVDLVEQLVRAFYNSKSYRAEAVTATLCLDGNPAFRLPVTEKLDSLDLPVEITIIVDWGIGGGGGQHALEFIAAAVAAGIVGNASYDAAQAGDHAPVEG